MIIELENSYEINLPHKFINENICGFLNEVKYIKEYNEVTPEIENIDLEFIIGNNIYKLSKIKKCFIYYNNEIIDVSFYKGNEEIKELFNKIKTKLIMENK